VVYVDIDVVLYEINNHYWTFYLASRG